MPKEVADAMAKGAAMHTKSCGAKLSAAGAGLLSLVRALLLASLPASCRWSAPRAATPG